MFYITLSPLRQQDWTVLTMHTFVDGHSSQMIEAQGSVHIIYALQKSPEVQILFESYSLQK